MTEVAIVVACHKPVPHPHGVPGYLAICNLAPDGTQPPGFDHYDDRGFPRLNQTYCELSALRALQQSHLHSDAVVGLVHYRRVFTVKAPRGTVMYPGMTQVRRFDWARPDEFGAAASAVAGGLETADWITAPKIDVRSAGSASLLDAWDLGHPRWILDVASKAIRAVDPKLPALEEYLSQTPKFVPFNMFLSRSSTLDQYTNFLWPVLEKCVAEIGILPDPYQRRYAGFLAERLHSYWLDVVGAPAGMVVSEVPVIVMDKGLVENSITGQQLDMRTRRSVVGGQWPARPLNNLRIRTVQRRARHATIGAHSTRPDPK